MVWRKCDDRRSFSVCHKLAPFQIELIYTLFQVALLEHLHIHDLSFPFQYLVKDRPDPRVGGRDDQTSSYTVSDEYSHVLRTCMPAIILVNTYPNLFDLLKHIY